MPDGARQTVVTPPGNARTFRRRGAITRYTRRAMQLVIAEKPSVARDLARVLGVRGAGKHAIADGQRVISWCIGHLVELEEPAAYDGRWKAWRLDTLPMIPKAFQLREVAGT